MCIWKHWIFSNATILVVCVVNNRERLLYFVSHSLSWNFPSFFSIAFSPPTPLSLSFSHKNNIFNVCFDKSTPRFSDTNLLVPKICFFSTPFSQSMTYLPLEMIFFQHYESAKDLYRWFRDVIACDVNCVGVWVWIIMWKSDDKINIHMHRQIQPSRPPSSHQTGGF